MVIPWFLIGEVPLYLVGPGVKAGVSLAPRASSSSSVLLSSLALSESKVYELSLLGRITKEDATHGRRLFGRHLPPTLTVRANSRSQDLGFALWHTAKTSVPQGKSEILRSTICSNYEGWWKQQGTPAARRPAARSVPKLRRRAGRAGPPDCRRASGAIQDIRL